MNITEDIQSELRQKANGLLRRLSNSQRETLLIKCWMSHDARWFMAVAQRYGVRATNHINQIAAHEVGKVEALRVVRALQLPPVNTLDDFLVAQEVFIGLLGPDLLEYGVNKVSDSSYRVNVRRCFAHQNAHRASIIDRYECGIFARVTGWLDGLGLTYESKPPLGKCLKAQGRECIYNITLGV
jgi:hypothetical protein